MEQLLVITAWSTVPCIPRVATYTLPIEVFASHHCMEYCAMHPKGSHLYIAHRSVCKWDQES